MLYNLVIHHRRSIRLKGYDYSQAGLYFITICCYNRECLFGDVVNGEMVLNDAGKFADECWNYIPDHFPNAILHEYIIMPNHIHGIIELLNYIGCTVGVQNVEPVRSPNEIDSSNGVQNIVSYRFRSIWQRNFWEHIIRNEQSYQRISEYIVTNPAKWGDDKFNTK